MKRPFSLNIRLWNLCLSGDPALWSSEGLSGSMVLCRGGQQVTGGGLRVQGQAVCLWVNPPAHTLPQTWPLHHQQLHRLDQEAKCVFIYMWIYMGVCLHNLSLVSVHVCHIWALTHILLVVSIHCYWSHQTTGCRCWTSTDREAGSGSNVTEKQKSLVTSIYHHSITLHLLFLGSAEELSAK